MTVLGPFLVPGHGPRTKDVGLRTDQGDQGRTKNEAPRTKDYQADYLPWPTATASMTSCSAAVSTY